MRGRRKILSALVFVFLVLSIFSVVVQGDSDIQEGEPVTSVELAVELDMEVAVGAVYDGDYDLFMYPIDGPVYQNLREEWRHRLETWEARTSYKNLFFNPSHEGHGTEEMGDAIDAGWIDEPEEVQWLANDVGGEWTVNPFAHEDIRFAMQYLNRQEIIDELLDGFADPRYSFMDTESEVWQDHFVEAIEEEYEMSPEGDEELMEQMIEDAMEEISEEVAFGEVSGGMDGWYYDPPDGEKHQIEIKLIPRVEDWRFDLARHTASTLQDLGFDAWIDSISPIVIPLVFFGSPEPYDNLAYHIYTGGWLSSQAAYYREAGAAQMYAPWYGFTQTYVEEERWNYDEEGYTERVQRLDQVSKELFQGQIGTEEEYWEKKIEATQLGFEESLRVFLLTEHSFYLYNPDTLLSAVTESVNGYDTFFGPRTMRTDDGHLDAVILTGVDRPYMDNWNAYGGSADIYGEYQRRIVREYGSWNHPQTGLPMEVNAYWSEGRETDPYERKGSVERDYDWNGDELIENIAIPEDAVDYVPSEEQWKTVEEMYDEDNRTAAVKVTLDVHEDHVWHDGSNFTLQDVMANYAREKRLACSSSEPYLESWEMKKGPWYDTIHAIEWDEENGTYTVYGDYTFPMGDKVGDHYAMFPEVHPLTYEGWDHLHGATEIYDAAEIDESYDYETGADNWIHQLSASQNEDLVTIMETMISEEYLPPYLDANNNAPIPMMMDEVETELNSLIDFIEQHDHSYVAAGPFYIEEYDTEDHSMTLERWDDYGYPFEGEEAEGVEFPYGYWAAQFEVKEVRLDSISAPTIVDLGEDFQAEGTGHLAYQYPESDKRALTEDEMEDYRFTLRDELGGDILVEMPAEEIDLELHEDFTDFSATIPTEEIKSGGNYTLQLEVRGKGDIGFTTISTYLVLLHPEVELVAHDWSIPEEVYVGEGGNIRADIENYGDEDDTARVHLIDQETGEEEMIHEEEVPTGERIEISHDHTFEDYGIFSLHLRDGEDRHVKGLGEILVLGADIEALTLEVDPMFGEAPLETVISMSAENHGTASGEIDLEIDGDVIETFVVSSGAEFFQTVEYTFEDKGTYTVSFGHLESPVEVVEEVIITPVELIVPEEVMVGDTETITATVESHVEETTAHLYVAREEVHVEEITEEGVVTFEYEHTFEKTGEIEVEVRDEEDRTIMSDTVMVLDRFELVINAEEGGTTDPEPGTYTHAEGEEVTVEAISEDGYVFVEWTGDYESGEEEITVTMDENKTITAVFEEEEDTPGFVLAVLVLAVVISVVIYYKKEG